MRPRSLLAILLLAGAFASLAGVMAQSSAPPPAPPGEAKPGAPAQSQTGPNQKSKAKVPAGPKIVRWVCTDRICGGCDGGCSRHGHVAVSGGGHCACTPTEGSALDQAIRKAFAGHETGH
jgi:hypothetical protein